METKQEFIDGLRRALTGRISQEEVEEHIRYYEDYITAETRIKGSEQDVLDALGNPKHIAMSICAAGEAEKQSKAGYKANNTGYGNKSAYEDIDGNESTYSDDYSYESDDRMNSRRNGRTKDSRPFIFRHPKLTIAMIVMVILVVIVLFIALAFSLLKLLWPVIVVVAIVMLIVHLMAYFNNN